MGLPWRLEAVYVLAGGWGFNFCGDVLNYEKYISKKTEIIKFKGIEEIKLNDAMFPHQKDLTTWALKKGRAAVFADTGLGKTFIQIEWAKNIPGRVLILAPLAVAEQTIREGKKYGVNIEYDNKGNNQNEIVISNYEHIEKFNHENFTGIVIDESSILKSFDGKTRNLIINKFESVYYKLACTATPAPNDYMELGNHSEFLGVKSRAEMLAEFFTHDMETTQKWRLKGHAEDIFWKWVCTWAAVIKLPSDLGYEDKGYKLPKLNIENIEIKVDHTDAQKEGFLFIPEARTLNEQRAAKRMTLDKRIEEAVGLSKGHEPVLIWCELNTEGGNLEKLIPDSVQVQGSDTIEKKKERLLGFADGKYRVLITKPSIAGFGMNWQHCNKMIFVGIDNSYEKTYQAIRRCWRFGQKKEVTVYMIFSEIERGIIQNLQRKQEEADNMMNSMIGNMAEIMKLEIKGSYREWNDYNPKIKMKLPKWINEEVLV
jgi:superfamily II DNA or RNA helicase